jgi:hypothetical protein
VDVIDEIASVAAIGDDLLRAVRKSVIPRSRAALVERLRGWTWIQTWSTRRSIWGRTTRAHLHSRSQRRCLTLARALSRADGASLLGV